MKVAVVDGMGGSVGYQIVTRLRKELPDEVEIIVLGTNAQATAKMMKAKANRGASGENAIAVSIKEADMIVAPLSVVVPNAMMGEVTPRAAEAIAMSKAEKILLPLTNPKMDIVGTSNLPLPHLMDEAVEVIKKKLGTKRKETKKDVRSKSSH